MDSGKILAAAAIILIIAAGAFLLKSGDYLTGEAITGFSASVEVISVTIDNINFDQLNFPDTDGEYVNISMPVNYSGSGEKTVTVAMPETYETGYDWYITEGAERKEVNASSDKLTWLANLSNSNATLYFTVPPPVIVTESETKESTSYEKIIRVGSEAHLVDVTASVPVDTAYRDFSLEIHDGTWKEATYGFSVNDGIARWSGFNLSTKRFRITGEKDADDPGGSGGGGTRKLYIEENIEENETFSVEPQWFNIEMGSDEARSVEITIENLEEQRKGIDLDSASNFLSFKRNVVLDDTEKVEVRIHPQQWGEQLGRIKLDDGEQKTYVFFELKVHQAEREDERFVYEPQEAPKEESPSPIEAEEIDWRSINLALLALTILLYGLVAVIYYKK